jgi:hypothetical protein
MNEAKLNEVNIWIPVDDKTKQVNDLQGVVGFTRKAYCDAWVANRNKEVERQGGHLCGFKAGKVKAVRLKIKLPKGVKSWKEESEMLKSRI